jgi:hypothetical protein
MAHTLFKYLLNMIVIQGIIDHLAVSSVFDQGSLLKHPQLMRYGGLGHVQEIGNVTDTHLGFGQCPKDPYSGGIAEYLEKFCQIIEGFLLGQSASYPVYDILMDDITITFFNGDIAPCHGITLTFPYSRHMNQYSCILISLYAERLNMSILI